LGCQLLDKHFKGGLLTTGITELTGGSATGKTQICLQLCLTVQLPMEYGGLDGGALYISTEDLFPSERLEQLIRSLPSRYPQILHSFLRNHPFKDYILVNHARELHHLERLLENKIPKFLCASRSSRPIKLLIIDSLTALFRTEFGYKECLQRSHVLHRFASALKKLSHIYHLPVVIVNQVSDWLVDVDSGGYCADLVGNAIPSLGLVWSNMVNTRIALKREEQVGIEKKTFTVRTMSVLLSPNLP
jgi:DNA-repair protein XRCC3